MLSRARKLWRNGLDLLPATGFHFARPLVLLQSDDWGRAGLRDQEGLEQLRAAGIELGERPYDLYTLETSDDVAALHDCLRKHRDCTGRSPCCEMNFVLANLDFARMKSDQFREIHLLPLAEGLPDGWHRPGLIDAFREGIRSRVFVPALHGTTHFCRRAVERHLSGEGERGTLLRKLWQAGTPYIYWRMPWIGFEYWDPEGPDEQFLPALSQADLIGQAVGLFSRMFSVLPHSACAPGYRANEDTHRAWAQYGVRVAQNGPGKPKRPHFRHGGILHLYRTVEFEPGIDLNCSVAECLRRAEDSFALGIPAIISVHSINFHSSISGFRSRTLSLLDELLSALEAKHPDLVYVHDREVVDLVTRGFVETAHGTVRVQVTKKGFFPAALARRA